MVEILLFLATHCAYLFEPGRFRIVDSKEVESFGNAVVVLESPVLRMHFARDRGQLLMEFQPIDGKRNEWFSLGPLRGVLLGDRGGSEVLDDEWARFLGEVLDELETRFADPASRAEMIDNLHVQERERAKALFG